MASRVVKKARAFGEHLLEEPEEPTVEVELTVAEERRKVMRIARRQYAAQLLPWKILTALLVAGLYVNGQDWSPWGVLPWTMVLAIGSFLVTEWRLGGRHVKSGRIDWGNPRGRKQQRIRRRALRSAIMGAIAGLWLVAVTITDPAHLAGHLVWLVGAGLWATFSYHGWWQPADAASNTPDGSTADEEPDDDPASDPWPDAPLNPATPAAPRRARAGGVPVPRRTAAQATAAAVAEEETRAQVPDISLLKTEVDSSKIAVEDDRTEAIQGVIDQHKLDAKVVDRVRAPAITRYAIQLGPGEQVDKFMRRVRDFALACGSKHINMLAPIEGSSLIGIEVPNKDRTWVTAGEVLASPEARRDRHPLLVVLGKDADGNWVIANLAKMPHVLLAGETGGGKSGGIASMLMSILTRATPDEVQLLLIDIKRVELTPYQGIPHLVRPVVTKVDEAGEALKWVVDEVDRRYEEMARAGVKHIDQLNEKIISGEHTAPPGARYTMRPFPYLGVFVDELADLLMRDENGEVEDAIVRIAQLARAAGIHLVLATQRPSSDVITSLIKANIPGRIAYRTNNHRDSMVIIDEPGAEKLLGMGDCLVKLSGQHTVRVQGCLVVEEEVTAVTAYWRDEAARKGLAVPTITLSATARDNKPAQPKVTAYDSVLAAAARLVDHDGRVTRDQIVQATKGLSDSARNNALTNLFNDKILGKVKGQQAVYILLRTSTDEPLPQEEEVTQ